MKIIEIGKFTNQHGEEFLVGIGEDRRVYFDSKTDKRFSRNGGWTELNIYKFIFSLAEVVFFHTIVSKHYANLGGYYELSQPGDFPERVAVAQNLVDGTSMLLHSGLKPSKKLPYVGETLRLGGDEND